MLRTNLATRPFYNERAVRFVLGVVALIVLGVTAFNALELLRLTDSQRTLGAHAVVNATPTRTPRRRMERMEKSREGG